MHKLKLDLERLIVESFDTDVSGIARRGTVRAHSEFCIFTVAEVTCLNTCDTCGATCSCGASCAGSCGGSCGCTDGNSCYGSCVDPTCSTCQTNCQQVSCVETCP